jgi:hypothetical protein
MYAIKYAPVAGCAWCISKLQIVKHGDGQRKEEKMWACRAEGTARAARSSRREGDGQEITAKIFWREYDMRSRENIAMWVSFVLPSELWETGGDEYFFVDITFGELPKCKIWETNYTYLLKLL